MEVDVKESCVLSITDQLQNALLSGDTLTQHLTSHLETTMQVFCSSNRCQQLSSQDLLIHLTTLQNLLQTSLRSSSHFAQMTSFLPTRLPSILVGLLSHSDQFVVYLASKCLSRALVNQGFKAERREVFAHLMGNLSSVVSEDGQFAEAILDVFSLIFSTRKLAVQNFEDLDESLKECRCQALATAKECWKKLAAQFLLPKVGNTHMLESFLKLWKKLLRFQQSLNGEGLRDEDDLDWTKNGLHHAVMLVGNFINREGHSPLVYRAALKVLASLLPSVATPTASYRPEHTAIATLIMRKVEAGIITKCPLVANHNLFGGTDFVSDYEEWIKSQSCEISEVPVVTGSGEMKADNSSLRQLFLLILRSCMVTLRVSQKSGASRQTVGSVGASLGELSRWVSDSGQISQHVGPSSYTIPLHSWLVPVFADQDDQLIEAMIVSLDIYTTARFGNMDLGHSDVTGQGGSPHIEQLNPHVIFLEFLNHVSHDHTVLLDLLTSPETVFLLYLIKYLHLVVNTWDYLVHTCSQRAVHQPFQPGTESQELVQSDTSGNSMKHAVSHSSAIKSSTRIVSEQTDSTLLPTCSESVKTELEKVAADSHDTLQAAVSASARCDGITETLLKYESSGRELANGLANILHKITGERLRLAESVLLNQVDDSVQQLQMSRDNMTYLLKEANAAMSEGDRSIKESQSSCSEHVDELAASSTQSGKSASVNDVSDIPIVVSAQEEPMDCEAELTEAMERHSLKGPANYASGVFPQLTYYSDSDDDSEEPAQRQQQMSDLQLLQDCSQYLTRTSDCAALMTVIGQQSSVKSENIVTYSDSDSDSDEASLMLHSQSQPSLHSTGGKAPPPTGLAQLQRGSVQPQTVIRQGTNKSTKSLTNQNGQISDADDSLTKTSDGRVTLKKPVIPQNPESVITTPTVILPFSQAHKSAGLDNTRPAQHPSVINVTDILHNSSPSKPQNLPNVVNYSDSDGSDSDMHEDASEKTNSHSCFHNIKKSFHHYRDVTTNTQRQVTTGRIGALAAYSDSSDDDADKPERMEEEATVNSENVEQSDLIGTESLNTRLSKNDSVPRIPRDRKTSSSEVPSDHIGHPPPKRKRIQKPRNGTSSIPCHPVMSLDKRGSASDSSTLHCGSGSSPHIDCECGAVRNVVSDLAQKHLDDMFSVLICLRLSIERLSNRGLFPFNAQPLISIIEQCESLYES